LALVPKDESPSGFAGKYIPVPLVFGTPQGRSATFANAQNNQTAPQVNSFFVYRVSNYQIVTITNELLLATKDDAGAFVDEAKLNMDTGFRNLSNDLAHDLFASGTGSRGSIGAISGTTTVTITLSDVNSVVQFEVGMTLVAAATDGGSPVANDSIVLTSVNRTTGVIIGTATGTPGADWSAGYFLYVQGDIPSTGASTTGSFLKVTGLSGWLPTTSPTSSLFWNVDRSQDPTRLGGVRYNGQSLSLEESLVNAAALVAREGGQPDMCFMNFASYAALENSLGKPIQMH
jgi:hypothetical protein